MPEILHIVLFKWKPDVSDAQIEEVRKALLALGDAVPGILSAECGPNLSQRSQGYQTVLVVRFKDRQALDNYLPHPAHQDVVARFIDPIRDNLLVADLEIQGT